MKKVNIFLIESFVLLLLILGTSVLAIGQSKNTKTIDKTKVNPEIFIKKPVITQQLELKNAIPYFSNVKPINSQKNYTKKNIGNLKPVGSLPAQDFVIRQSSVNGTMTARDPYINSLSYIEFLNGDVLPGENNVDCACGSGLTYVKLVLRATAGKRYLVTTKVSPRRGDSFGLSMFSSGFVHNAGVNRNNEEVSIVLSPQTSGQVELWMQCSDPNTAKRPWTFHSMTVEEID